MISRIFLRRILGVSLLLTILLIGIIVGCSVSQQTPVAHEAERPLPALKQDRDRYGQQVEAAAQPQLRQQVPAPVAPLQTKDTSSYAFGDLSTVAGRSPSSTLASKSAGRQKFGALVDAPAATPVSVTPQPLKSKLAPEDELWVIERAKGEVTNLDDDQPRSGALLAKTAAASIPVPVPLKHTDVKTSIAGYIATVDVTQQYHNPFSEKIEAIYVFPLPTNAAVNDFLMTIGDRKIRGIIRERGEAERIYKEARSQGHVASLLTQERPNIFTQSVANIEPGKQIDINIKYFHTLQYVDGWYEYNFPMVVGPRFNPPETTDGVGATPRGQHGATGQKTEVQYLKPTERSGHDISLSVHVDAGVPIEEVESTNHRINTQKPTANARDVTLASDDSIPNKDFVLRYKVSGKTIKSAVMAQRSENGDGYFTLMIYPPESLSDLPRQPLELVFTLDVSGSMSGAPLEQSKAAIRYALKHMQPADTFQVIRFANGADQLSGDPLSVTPANVAQALRFIESTQAGGGTVMIEGIRNSLNFPHDENRLRFVSFLTDGYIGNERDILAEVQKSVGPGRIFSFGVGSATNRYLLDHMAKLGRGAVAYLSLNDNADDVMQLFFDRISHPALTNVSIDWGGLSVSEVYPNTPSDLFVGRPIIVTGKFSEARKTVVRIKGKAGGETRQIEVPLDLSNAKISHEGVAAVWARMKIAELSDRAIYDSTPQISEQIREVALHHNLLSQFTSFVAVDSMSRTAGDHGTTVAVPVPVPDGVQYETTVHE
jgi:Ca-activated chloride channel family protein